MAASKRQQKVAKAKAPLRVTVKFLKDCDPGNGKPVFKAGLVKELVISSANHWIRRGRAVKYVEAPVRIKSVKPKRAKSVRSRKRVAVKAEPVVVENVSDETVSEETPDEETVVVENVSDETVSEETPDEETADEKPAIEEKKTEDGGWFGGTGDPMT